MMTPAFWSGKRVFLTGHTGFKGSWLSLWLQQFGSIVRGYALQPPTAPSLFEQAAVGDGMESVIADVRDSARLANELKAFRPDIVIHMAAQSLVRKSYEDPLTTYSTNVMGTVALFEAVRAAADVRVVVNVTSDKCYENRESMRGYRETDPMGGHDPYSSSKGCAELVGSSYSRSFFHDKGGHAAAVASARAGNVIGGGDWAKDRFVPDVMRAVFAGRAVGVRHPGAVRPWQHVLEPLRGYLMLAEKLWSDGRRYAGAWNFGPRDADVQPVRHVLALCAQALGRDVPWEDRSDPAAPHEATLLTLDISKADRELGWAPVWHLRDAVDATVAWYVDAESGADMRARTLAQITAYSSANRDVKV